MVSFKGWKSVFAMVLALSGMLTPACNKTDVAVSDPVPSCFDSILNQGEIEVDCGGPCPSCPARMTAKVDGVTWESQGGVASTVNGNNILISAGNGSSTISIIYSGPFVNGTFNLTSALYSTNNPVVNYTANTGSVTFIEWSSNPKQVSGFFSFKAFEISGTGDSVVVNNGKFTFVSY